MEHFLEPTLCIKYRKWHQRCVADGWVERQVSLAVIRLMLSLTILLFSHSYMVLGHMGMYRDSKMGSKNQFLHIAIYIDGLYVVFMFFTLVYGS